MNELDLFTSALALSDPAERGAYLDRACADNPDLRRRLDELLSAHARGGNPLDSESVGVTGEPLPAGATATFGTDASAPTADFPGKDERAGAVIGGKYTLVEAIGEGGMGTVWRAKQTEPVKRFVAVKLIKAGMDSKQVLARFEAERQALAMMDHPNIARVLDGGLHDARPYFVMELVKGVPITDYCDKCKLTPKQRLELFVPVCQAIQHAHQKGIIHRDIKPSNVLIALYDDKPVVKVIDFGVAKATGPALTEHTIDTGFGGVVGTPQYMSPEQATFNNLDIDTRSDVYALGVLLYELLAGSPPFSRTGLEKRGLLEMLRVVREEEPPRPSTKLSTADALPTLSANRGTEPKKLTALLRSELDWIVMKALEKDRTRRYETANGFAADVLRYLAGEAVQAHPPSTGYRLRKFVRRNKGQVIAASLVIVALLAGIVGTTWGMIRADRARADESEQRKLAEANEQKANNAKVDADTQRAKADVEKQIALAVKDFLQNKLLAQADLNIQHEALMKLGGLPSEERAKFNPTVRELLDRAARELSEANIEANFPGQPLLQAELLQTVGLAYRAVDARDPAKKFLERSFALRVQHLGLDHPDTLAGMSTFASASGGADKEGLRLREEALNRSKAALGPDHPDTLKRMTELGQAYFDFSGPMGDKSLQGTALLDEAFKRSKASLGADHTDTLARMATLGMYLAVSGKHEEGASLVEEALKLTKNRHGPDHPGTLEVMNALGWIYVFSKKAEAAVPLLEEAYKLAKAKLGPQQVGGSAYVLGWAYNSVGKHNLADKLMDEMFAISRAQANANANATELTVARLKQRYLEAKKWDQVVAVEEEELSHTKARRGPEHVETLRCMHSLGQTYESAGKPERAVPLFEELLRLQKAKRGQDHADTQKAMGDLAKAYSKTGKPDLALALIREKLKWHDAHRGQDEIGEILTLATLIGLAKAYQSEGKLDLAVKLHEEAFRRVNATTTGDSLSFVPGFGISLLEIYVEIGEKTKALAVISDLVPNLRKYPWGDPLLAAHLAECGLTAVQLKAFAEAEPLLREALALREKTQPNAWYVFNTQSMLGGALLGQKKYAEAEPLLLKGYEGMKAREKTISKRRGGELRIPEALDRLVEFHTATGKPDEAKKWRAERAKYPFVAPMPRSKP